MEYLQVLTGLQWRQLIMHATRTKSVKEGDTDITFVVLAVSVINSKEISDIRSCKMAVHIVCLR